MGYEAAFALRSAAGERVSGERTPPNGNHCVTLGHNAQWRMTPASRTAQAFPSQQPTQKPPEHCVRSMQANGVVWLLLNMELYGTKAERFRFASSKQTNFFYAHLSLSAAIFQTQVKLLFNNIKKQIK